MNNPIRHSQYGGVANSILQLAVFAAFVGFIYWNYQSRGDQDEQASLSESESSLADAADFGDDATHDDVDTAPTNDTPNEGLAEESAPLTDKNGNVFSYLVVGDLLPESGPGFFDQTIYRPDIAFPTEGPAYLNSQVYRYGGYYGSINQMEGGQCEPENYVYPWQDTFCEKRSRDQALCPGGGHEGLDIRPASCDKNIHWAVATEDARVVDVRRHWVTLQTADGTLYNYLHLNMAALEVAEGDLVAKGDRIGLISNDFYKSDGTSVATTIHLHFEMYENYVADEASEPLFTKVNPYVTLVAAYDRKLRQK